MKHNRKDGDNSERICEMYTILYEYGCFYKSYHKILHC